MSTVQYYMDYQIFFQDPSEYALAVAIAGGNVIKLAPRDAATLFGIPFPYPSGDMSLIPKGITFFFPYTVGAEFRFPGASGIFVSDTVLTTVVPGQAGNPVSVWPAGPDGVFTWSGNITTNKGAATHSEPVPTAIPQRRWIYGGELAQNLEGISTQDTGICRDYSRTIDGIGYGVRGADIASSNRVLTQFRTGLATRVSWERFYIRVRKRPAVNNVMFWRTHGTGSNAAGVLLQLRPDGTIHSADINSISIITDKGVLFTPTINQWYKLDLFLFYAGGLITPTGLFKAYVNGVFTQSWSSPGSGLGEGNGHASTDFGASGTTDAQVEIDLDDWFNSDLPANMDTGLNFIDGNYPIDFLVGSHIRAHYNVSVSQTNWAPAATALILNQGISPTTRTIGTAEVTSTTASATLEGLTDAVLKSIADSLANVVGAVASIISIWSKNAAATDGQLGYKVAGGAAVLATIDQGAAEAVNFTTYFPTGQITPAEISPWSIVHNKSADANLDTTYEMLSVVEYIGVWGVEDDPTFQFPVTRLSFLHNCRYANTAWGYMASKPQAPQYSIGFTYVGNGGYQEFVLPAACHFLRIRPVTDTTAGVNMFAASLGAHLGTTDEIAPGIRMWFDLTNGQFKLSVQGSSGNGVNITGKTYQVIAFCDPGMRFCIASAFRHPIGATTPQTNALVNPNFTPDVAFFQFDFVGSSSVGNGAMVKGPNDATQSARNLQSSNQIANSCDFSKGFINSYAALHLNSTGPCNFIAFRKQDSGPSGCLGNVAIQIVTYTGNGAGGNRAIPITPTSGRFPLWTLVWPSSGSGAAYTRDPSHTGSNSSTLLGNANAIDAITALAVDQVTVGPTLNVNNVPYTIFIICGDSAGNNNGTFFATFCTSVDPPWVDPVPPSTSPNILGNGGLVLGGAAAFTIIKDASGVYTLVPGQAHDSLVDRNTAPSGTVNVKIPDPTWKTGYLGG